MSRRKNNISVWLVGGGSGGHVTPLRELAKTLVERCGPENVKVTFISEKKGSFDEVMSIPEVTYRHKISAGKFRRYHGDSLLDHLKDVKTILLNLRDLFLFIKGCFGALSLLIRKRPDVIFLKGGFVCVPVGWAAMILHIPYVTHDSDVIPGLANRMTGKSAVKNLVAMTGVYPYDSDKTIVTGIPIDDAFFDASNDTKKQARTKLSLPQDAVVALITGGGLGAKMMNTVVINALQTLATSDSPVEEDAQMVIVHLTGKALYNNVLDEYEATKLDPNKLKVVDFTTEMHLYMQAADMVISRAGATAIAETAAAQKACIFIPGAHLTGGQQIHNASLLDKKDAAIVVLEHDVVGIAEAIKLLATNEPKRRELSTNIAQFAVQDSAEKIVSILIKITGADIPEHRDATIENGVDSKEVVEDVEAKV